MSPPRVILLSCGSYNPPTNMHLRIFEIARDHLHRMGTHTVVGGVISPVHDDYGKKELVNVEHRCAMLKCALQNNEWIRVSTWESCQNSWTPTRLVLQHHQNLLNTVLLNSADMKSCDFQWIPENIRNSNDRTPIQIKLVCGADLLESFGVPGLWAEEDIDAIVGEHGLVVVTREGSNPNKFIYDSDILSRHIHNINIVTEWICNEISSTKIRRALRRGESVRYLTQDSVIDYIQCHGLYNSKTLTKLTLLSTNDSNNYLHIDSKYESAFLTPSPSDITMITPSPVEIISIDIAESVIKKNLINLPKSRVTTSIATTTTISTTENTECIRDKFMDIIADNGNKISTTTPKSFYPGQARQIIATETGESQIFREVGSHDTGTSIHQSNSINDNEKNLDSFNNSNSLKCKIEDNTVSEKNIDVDGNISSSISNSETIRPDVVVAENETSQDDVGDSLRSASSIENEEKNIPLSVKIQKNTEISDEKLSVSHSISEITKETNNEFLNVNTDKQTDRVRKFVVDLNSQCNELDGKYRKSIVKSRKSPKHGNNLSEQVVPKMREAKNSSKQNIKNKDAKNLDVILLKNELTRKNYLGSLESINAKKPTALSKKSKSFEFIKTDFSLKEIDINYDVDTLNSSEKMSNSAIVTDETKNISCDNEVIDELCSVCCYGKNESSTKKMYTVHSNNSSPLELDTTECELCSSRNIPDSKTAPGEPQCELCEICGDIAMDMDVIASSRPETDELINARILAGSRHLPLSVAKQKISAGRLRMDEKIFDITDEDVDGEDADDESRQPSFRGERLPSTSVEEYSADDSTLDDVEFEIENCGLEIEGNQSLKKTVSATPEAIDKIKIEELDIIKEGSESKLMIRGTSLISRNTSKPDSRRRYSSVDNLPNSKQKVGSKSNESPCKLSVKTQNKVTQSINNDRISRITKNPNNIRKSMDNVAGTSQDVNKCQGKHESQLSNEQIDVTNEQQKDEHRIGPDTVRFIIGKHGLKIISDRETSL